MVFQAVSQRFFERRSKVILDSLMKGIQTGSLVFVGLLGILLARVSLSMVAPESAIINDLPGFANQSSNVSVSLDAPLGETNPFLPLSEKKAAPKVRNIPVTRLELTLHGTRSDDEGGSAVISEGKSKQRLYLVGDILGSTKAELISVASDHVIISRAGQQEKLVIRGLSSALPGAPTASDARVSRGRPQARYGDGVTEARVTYKEWNKVLKGLDLKKVARRRRGGGVEIFPPKNPLFDRLGLQRGDVIVSVDGNPLTDNREIVKLMGRLADPRPLEIELLRDGNPHHLQIEFTGG